MQFLSHRCLNGPERGWEERGEVFHDFLVELNWVVTFLRVVRSKTCRCVCKVCNFIKLFMYRVSMFSHLILLKVLILFFFSILPVDPFHARNPLLSHSSCYFLHQRISSSSLSSSSSRRTPFQFFFRDSLFSISLRTWPYQFNCIYLMQSNTEFYIFIFLSYNIIFNFL